MIFDKDTGKVYDIRNESHVSRITDKATRLTMTSPNSSSANSSSQKKGAWADWWKEKRQND